MMVKKRSALAYWTLVRSTQDVQHSSFFERRVRDVTGKGEPERVTSHLVQIGVSYGGSG